MDNSVWQNGRSLWDLVNHLKECGALRSGNIFRGQKNKDWGLVPSLYRNQIKFDSPGKSMSEKYITAEQYVIDNFFDRGMIFLKDIKRNASVDRILAQHYGAPTQLLDWSNDPFIAMYFACQDGDPNRDGAIFYISPNRGAYPKWPFAPPYVGGICKLYPPMIDERIKMQKSLFTIQNFGEDPEKFTPIDQRKILNSDFDLEGNMRAEAASFGKVVIPSDLKKIIRMGLSEIGVDSSIIFPGLQGIGERIDDLISIKGGITGSFY